MFGAAGNRRLAADFSPKEADMMKSLFLVLLFAGFAAAQTYPEVSLDSMNFIPADSLRAADSLQAAGAALRASLTDSRYLNDTITVTGVLTTDTRVIRNVGGHFSFYIQSLDGAEWGGMNIYTADTSANVLNAGFGSIDSGSVIQVTGRLTKYGTDVWGNFELIPIGSATVQPIPVNIMQVSGPRPAPTEVKVSDLVTGELSAGGQVHLSTGAKYKNSYVIVRNLTVKTRTQNSSSGQWTVTLQDSLGNTMSLYDPSMYFTGRSYGATPKYVPPPVGSKIDYVRGILATYSSTGYEIIPLYPGDVKIGVFTPSITATGFSGRRSTAFPRPTDPVNVRITAVSISPDPNVKVDSAAAYYSVNNRAYVRVKMTPDTSNTFYASIPPQDDGSFVEYFFTAWQDTAAFMSMTPDTSRTAFFYYVKSSGYKIRDIQYTPFKDGNSGVIDLSVTVNGIVQADTNDFPPEIDHRNQATKTPYVYIQDGASPYSGIVLFDSVAYGLHRGDSVSVTGIVSEYSGMTEITVDTVKVIQTGRPTYAPVVLKTGTVGAKVSGDPTAEQWESMLIKFDTVTIKNNDPDPSYSITSANGSFREYTVSDGSGECRVDDDGNNIYSPDPHDTTYGFYILKKGGSIASLTGVLRYANGNYKLEPRTNADFGTVTGIMREQAGVPAAFALDQNFPNPFNPMTTIRYSVPKAGVVTLKVYNILGQMVATLVNQHQSAGAYKVTFEATRFASGVYFYRLTAGSFSSVKKMMLLK